MRWKHATLLHIKDNPKDVPTYVFCCCLFYMGIRPGEAKSLKIGDIRGNFINIRKTLSNVPKRKIEKGFIETSTKEERSNRLLEMPYVFKKILDEYQLYLHIRGITKKDNFLFTYDGETPLVSQTQTRKFKEIAKKACLPEKKLYVLRHSHASYLLNAGAWDEDVARRMGHTVEELKRTYFHLYRTREGECVRLLDCI
ncbi:hypothetical protein A4S06_11685 [Erysipelotrichaceae bacterium MTC7]|nr:hypothetical protein A4S06_11685 [Erysipelotrichaceae bacterium MTC7]